MKFVAILPFAIAALAQTNCGDVNTLACIPEIAGVTTDSCCPGLVCRILEVGGNPVVKRVDISPIAQILQCQPPLAATTTAGSGSGASTTAGSGSGASTTAGSGSGASTTISAGSPATTTAACGTVNSLLCIPEVAGLTTDSCCEGLECRILEVGGNPIVKRVDISPIAQVLQCQPRLASTTTAPGGSGDASTTAGSGSGASTTVSAGSPATTTAACGTVNSLLCIPGVLGLTTDSCCAGLECRILEVGGSPIVKRVDISPIAEVLQCQPIRSTTSSAAQSSTTAGSGASTTATGEDSTTAEETTTMAETTGAETTSEPSTTKENGAPIYPTEASSTTCPYSYPPETTTYLTSYTTYCPITSTVYYHNKPHPTTYYDYSTVTVTVYPTKAIEYKVKPTVYVTYYTTYFPVTKTEIVSYTPKPTTYVTYSTVEVTVHPNPSNPAEPSKEIHPAPVYTYPGAPASSAPAEYKPVQQIGDGQIQNPAKPAASSPVEQIVDGQIQNPAKPAASSPVEQIADGQIQSPAKPSNGTSYVSPSKPETYTGAAGKVVVSFGAVIVVAMGVVAL